MRGMPDRSRRSGWPANPEKGAECDVPPPRLVICCFPGIPAESAGAMFFMSPGSPVVWRTTMMVPHLPKGDSDRGDSYDPFPCPSDRNM